MEQRITTARVAVYSPTEPPVHGTAADQTVGSR